MRVGVMKHVNSRSRLTGLVMWVAVLVVAGNWVAADAQAQKMPPVKSHKVAADIWMLQAAGGNMTALLSEEGTLLVDSSFQPFVPEIIKKLQALGGDAPRIIVNTHYHADHTSGNAAFRAKGALVIAQANAARRMRWVQRAPLGKKKPQPVAEADLPDMSYQRRITLQLGDHDVVVKHIPPAHTDGDSVVFFEDANVVATGDLYFNGMYPYIDVNAGGSVGGTIAGLDWLLAKIDEDTVLIPGHGAVSNKAEMRRYRDMLVSMRDKVRKLINEGKSLQEIQALKPTRELDATWDRLEEGKGARRFVGELYYSQVTHFPGQ